MFTWASRQGLSMKLGLIGCRSSSIDLINILEDVGINFDLIISIDPKTAFINKVADYYCLSHTAYKKNIKYLEYQNYSLVLDNDQVSEVLAQKIDVFIALDWQRLIPGWLLENTNGGIFGVHSPSKLLPYGRGRSPINWNLIQNKNQMVVHLIKYDPGVDGGDIVGTRSVDITDLDDCHTLYLKQTSCAADMIISNLNFPNNNHTKQVGVPSYYPKRTEKDGEVNWHDSAKDIYNLVRAVTRPFPGAFSKLKSSGVCRIWKVIPFDAPLYRRDEIGRIVEVYHDGSFVVTCGGYSLLLVQDYEYEGLDRISKGRYFNCSNERKDWKGLPE